MKRFSLTYPPTQETALRLQLRIYLQSQQDDIKTLISTQVISELIALASKPDYTELTYIARFSLALTCKVLSAQAVLTKCNMLPLLCTFHLFPVNDGPILNEHVQWLNMLTKELGNLTLKPLANSLFSVSVKLLEKTSLIANKSKCLKSIAYLYITKLVSDKHYSSKEIELIIEHLTLAVDSNNYKYTKAALKAAGSLMMYFHEYWQGKWPSLDKKIIGILLKYQNIKIRGFQSDILEYINNDAKLILILADNSIFNIYK